MMSAYTELFNNDLYFLNNSDFPISLIHLFFVVDTYSTWKTKQNIHLCTLDMHAVMHASCTLNVHNCIGFITLTVHSLKSSLPNILIAAVMHLQRCLKEFSQNCLLSSRAAPNIHWVLNKCNIVCKLLLLVWSLVSYGWVFQGESL